MTKVLVAEDERRIREFLVDTLIDAGYEVFEAADGSNALETACQELPDIVLLDIMMPAMDGFEVLRRLRENSATEETPVVLLTALDAGEGERTAMELGVEHYITKPIEPTTVERIVKVVLRDSQSVQTPITTGNTHLDRKLQGGIPLGSMVLIEGTSGSGKSVLCQHLIYGALELGHRVSCFISDDGARGLVAQMGSLGLPVSSHIRRENLHILPIQQPALGDDSGLMLSSLAQEMDRVPTKENLLVVDSITNLASTSEQHAVAGYFSQCKRMCGPNRSVILAIDSYALDAGMLNRLHDLCDAHFKLSVENIGNKRVRLMEVSKILGANQASDHLIRFEVEAGTGMRMIPIARVTV